MDHQAVFQHEVQMPGHRQVIDRDLLRQLLDRHLDDRVAPAEALALPDVFRLHILPAAVHNEVGAGTAQGAPVLQPDGPELVRVLLYPDVPGPGRHNLAGPLIIGLHHGRRDALLHQLRKAGGGTVCHADTGLPGKAAGGAEDQAVGVFQQLPVHHDEVVGQGVDAVVQGLRAGLKKLLGGERDKDGGGAGGEAPLNLNLVEAQGQAAHQPLLRLEVQGH